MFTLFSRHCGFNKNNEFGDVYYSQFQIAFPRALANFVGKLGTTYRTSKFGSQLANELANFKSKFATSPAQKYGYKIHKLNNRNFKQSVLINHV